MCSIQTTETDHDMDIFLYTPTSGRFTTICIQAFERSHVPSHVRRMETFATVMFAFRLGNMRVMPTRFDILHGRRDR